MGFEICATEHIAEFFAKTLPGAKIISTDGAILGDESDIMTVL